MDVIEELKFLGKFTQKKFWGAGGGEGGRLGRGGEGGGGGGGGGAYGGGQVKCERRIEVFVKK